MVNINNLDDVLLELGDTGSYQKRYYLMLSCVVIFSVFHLSYIFTTRDIKYRCLISECDKENNEYNPEWLKNAVPYKENIPSRCLRYPAKNNLTCAEFKNNTTFTCNEFVYERPERTIVHDFDIHCDDNLWKLTLAGTLNVVGQLVCLPISGYLSDRFGRKTMMVISILLSSAAGLLRSFSVSYLMFIILEFTDTALGSGMYSAAFILGMEIVTPKTRNLANTFLCCAFSFGQIFLGLIAWSAPSWRILLRIIYMPGFLYLSLWWLLPESIRWLLNMGKKEQVKQILEKIAKINNKTAVLEKNTLGELLYSNNSSNETCPTKEETCISIKKETLGDSLKSIPLILRILQCSYVWISCTFVYYGLTIQSVSFSSNAYKSFIFTVGIEIPAYIVCYFIMNRIGRKKIICTVLIFGGICCVSINYIAEEMAVIHTSLFLIGKFCSTIAYTVVYVYTTEMFPTSSRHFMFALCSMFGRFGSMIAPQVPLLTRVSKSLPLVMFGVMAVTSGFLSLLFPETLNTKLPNTVEEAVHIGRDKKISNRTE